MAEGMKNRFSGTQPTDEDLMTKAANSTTRIHLINDDNSLSQEEIEESMDSLKQKLDYLKSMIDSGNNGANFLAKQKPQKTSTFIDENILSILFVGALAIILGVTAYAFQGLYVAVLKRWSSAK